MHFCPHTLAFIEDVGGPELMMILFVALLLFGGKKLPELAKTVGKSVKEFKKAVSGVETEIKRAIEEASPDEPPPARLKPTPTAAPPTPAAPGKPASSPGEQPRG